MESGGLHPAGARKLPLLEALLAEHRSPLCRPERHGGVFAARGASGLGLDAFSHGRPGRNPVGSLCLAGLAPFRFVLELFIREEQLLARRPHELSVTVHAPETLVLEL